MLQLPRTQLVDQKPSRCHDDKLSVPDRGGASGPGDGECAQQPTVGAQNLELAISAKCGDALIICR
jgi:hypothetical protein